MYTTKIKRETNSRSIIFQMPTHIEDIAEKELAQQPFGGIITLKEYPELHILAPVADYEGESWTATRRIVDQLDQVTFGRKRK